MKASTEKYRLKSGATRWRYISPRRVDDDGALRRKRITRHGFTTQREAAKAMREAMGLTAGGQHVNPASTTVAGYPGIWLSGLSVKATTVADYRQQIELRLIPTVGGIRPAGRLPAGSRGVAEAHAEVAS